MSTHTFEPMSVGQIIDNALRIYKLRFLRFVTITAVVHVPIMLISIIFAAILQQNVWSGSTYSSEVISPEKQYHYSETVTREKEHTFPNPMPQFSPHVLIAGSIIAILFYIIGYVLCQAALTNCVSEYYMGRDISVKAAYQRVLPQFMTLIIAGILVMLIIMFGFILLIVPGIIFMFWYALTTPSIIVEQLSATEGMQRSKFLTSGNLGKIFGVSFIIFVITIVIAMPISICGNILIAPIFSQNTIMHVIAQEFTELIANILITPVGAITYILLYYDLRIRKEGFDLEMLAKSLNTENDPALTT